MTEHAQATLDTLVEGINGETVTTFLRRRLFADAMDIPSRKWSLLNQFSLVIANTCDARGIRQWALVGRKVKKGAKAFYIIVPLFIHAAHSASDQDDDTTTEDERTKHTAHEKEPFGFKSMPVFRIEDTEGEPVAYEDALKEFNPRSLPLIEVADFLGVQIHAEAMSHAYGSFSPRSMEIKLGTDDPLVFLHELSHAIDNELPGKNTSYDFNEVVAELSAAFLGSLYGHPPILSDTRGYIESYSGRGHVAFSIAKALGRVEAIYAFIVAREQNSSITESTDEEVMDFMTYERNERKAS